MEKKDLLVYSPVRYFENKTGANLKAGEMGLITAKKGLGKTSVLVQFGIDALLSDKGLVHVSFDQESSNVIAWYSSILSEIAKNRFIKLENITDDILKKRTILNFNQETFTLPKVASTIKALKDSGISIDSLVIDGLDLGKINTEDLECLGNYIKSEKMTAWFSYTNEAADLKNTLSSDKLKSFTTVAHLSAAGKEISLNILQNGDGTISLDAKTLLMSK